MPEKIRRVVGTAKSIASGLATMRANKLVERNRALPLRDNQL
jgi:hypothetical protein